MLRVWSGLSYERTEAHQFSTPSYHQPQICVCSGYFDTKFTLSGRTAYESDAILRYTRLCNDTSHAEAKHVPTQQYDWFSSYATLVPHQYCVRRIEFTQDSCRITRIHKGRAASGKKLCQRTQEIFLGQMYYVSAEESATRSCRAEAMCDPPHRSEFNCSVRRKTTAGTTTLS